MQWAAFAVGVFVGVQFGVIVTCIIVTSGRQPTPPRARHSAPYRPDPIREWS